MTKEQAKQRIDKLKKVIKYHRYLYHVLDRQEISDAALDSLKHELYQLEQRYPEFITPDSPTQRVGGEPLQQFKKVQHSQPMLSIEDIFSEDELLAWRDYLKRLAPDAEFNYFCELKMDGFAISLIYENGVFVCGSTRGNGKVGEDVTQNLKTIESIPLKLEIHSEALASAVDKKKGVLAYPGIKQKLERLIKKGKIEIRGEVYMTKKAFEKVNQQRKKEGKEPYANPRNTAAGSIRQLNPSLAASRDLSFLAYDIVTNFGQTLHSQEHQVLPILGFKTDPGQKCNNLKQVKQFWQAVARKRETLPFQIDGVVINVNDNALFERLGVAGKSPRGVRAFKFSPKQATTKVKDITVHIGRTGAVTPVAILEPHRVGGVTISRATLHNEDEIKRLGVKIGDTVIVERAGDVIPAVVKVLPELRTGEEKEFKMPVRCPVCGTRLVRPKGEVVWRCPNPKCPARSREFFYHFASKKAFDIKGLGPKIIDQLRDEGLISKAPDIFELKSGDLLPLERFAQKSAENLIRAIEQSKRISLSRFIYSLGIRHVGEETARDIADYFGDIENLKKASQLELQNIADIGPKVAASIYSWFEKKQNRALIDDFKKAGIVIINPQPKQKRLALEGKTFVFTGTLRTMTRDEAMRRLRLLGGNPSGSVSKQTDFLVLGKNPGSKLAKAKNLGVKIISEEEFLKLVQTGSLNILVK